MPFVTKWFSPPVRGDWKYETVSRSDRRTTGPGFYIYPYTWLLPDVPLTPEDVADGPSPLWITEIAADSPLGTVDSRSVGTWVIDLPGSFEDYLGRVPPRHAKTLRASLRRNADLDVRQGDVADLERLWPAYLDRIAVLAEQDGSPPWTDEEHELRRRFFTSDDVFFLSAYSGPDLLSVNVSLPRGGTVYDLACLRAPGGEAAKRGLGIFMTVKNVEAAIRRGDSSYDLLTSGGDYKVQFGASEKKLRHYVRCGREFAAHYGIPEEEVSEWL